MESPNPTETSKLVDHRQAVIDLAKRVRDPAIDVFCYYATGENPSSTPSDQLYNQAFDRTIRIYSLFTEIGLSEPDQRFQLFPHEQAAVNFFLNKQKEEQKNYANHILESNPSTAHMINILEQLAGHRSPNTTPKNKSYQEAQDMARADLAKQYGEDFERNMEINVEIKKAYQRKIESYQHQMSMIKTAPEEMTVHEAQQIAFDTLKQEIPLLIQDILEEGGKLYISPIRDLVEPERFDRAQDLPILTTDQLKQLSFELDSNTSYPQPYNILLDGQAVNLGPKAEFSEYVLRNITDLSLVRSFIGKNKTLGPEEIRKYFALSARIKLIKQLEVLLSQLNNYPANFLLKEVGKSYPNPNMSLINSLLSNLQIIHKDPYNIIEAYYIIAFTNTETRELKFNRTSILKYIVWQELKKASKSKPLTNILFSGREHAKPTATTNIQNTIATAVNSIKSLVRPQTADFISHQNSPPNPFEVSSFTRILADYKSLFTDPKFIITGHPWRHMRQLAQISELSTYPDQAIDKFSPYNIPEHTSKNQLYIRSNQPILPGKDKDGNIAIRIFTPEYARLTSIRIGNQDLELESGQDFSLQYEKQTGHYRAILTTSGLTKIENTSGVKTIVGIDPNQQQDGTPFLAKSLPIPQVEKLRSIGERLAQRGYSKVGENILALIEQRMQKHQPITTQDVEEAIKDGSRYVFTINVTNNPNNTFVIDPQSFTYLPAPDLDGKIPAQCAHTAMLMSEILNEVISKGSFYDSLMLNTVNIGFGHVFAGAPHADTRGQIDHFRIRHDATPQPNLKSYEEALQGSNANNQLSESQLQHEIFNVTTQILQRSFQDSLTRISNIFSKKIEQHVPVGPTDKTAHSYSFPKAVVEVGTLLDELQSQAAVLEANPEARKLFIQRLEQAKETWELAKTDVSTQRTKRQAYIELFGDFGSYYQIPLNSIDYALQLLSNL